MWKSIIDWISSYFSKVPSSDVVPQDSSIGIGVTTDVGAGFNAVKSVADVVKQEDAEMNTPEMIEAAKEKEKQAKIDKFNEDLQSGNTKEIRKDISSK